MCDGIEAASIAKNAAGDEGDPALAGAAAAHALLVKLLPDQNASWDRLLKDACASSPREAFVPAAIEFGRSAAAHWLERYGYAGAAAAGDFRSSGTTPAWSRCARPFVLQAADQIRAPSPDLNGVLHDRLRLARRGRGAPSVEDRAATDRLFWSEPPEETWNRVARAHCATQRVNLRQCAHWFAALNASMADAYLAAHESRRYFRAGSWYFLFGQAAQEFGAKNVPAEIRVKASVDNYPSVPAVVNGTAEEILQLFGDGDAHAIPVEAARPAGSEPRMFSRISSASDASALASSASSDDVFAARQAGYVQGQKIGRWIAKHLTQR
jgi:hypothetical protein